MDVRKLRQFLAIADSGSLSRAAERLHVAQPALSLAVKALETDLSVILIERHARGVTLTEAGKTLADQARIILREMERTEELIRARADNPGGTVTVAAPGFIAGALAVPLLELAQARHPDVRLRLVVADGTDGERDVKVCRCDLALTFNGSADSDIMLRPLMADELVAVSRRAAVQAKTASLVDLLGSRLVLPPMPDPLRLMLEEAASRHAVRLSPVLEANAPEAILELVRAGCVTVLPASVAQTLASQPELSLSWLNQPRIPVGLYMAIPAHRPLSLSAQELTRTIADVVDRLIVRRTWCGRFIGSTSSSGSAYAVVTN
jgi:LysR family nitrogen assimilation transcriptional regulator